MNKGNQRLPFLALQNKRKGENSNVNKLRGKGTDQNVNVETEDMLGYSSNLKSISCKQEEPKASERKLAEEEHNKCLAKALQCAIEENEKLRETVQNLIEENKSLTQENEEKDNAIIELAQFYEHCKKHHKASKRKSSSADRDKRKKKCVNRRKSKSL